MTVAECRGWAPGLNIPHGQCVFCGEQRENHAKAAQSGATGKVQVPGAIEFALADSPIASHPSVISPAANAGLRPDVVFCRHCNQGMVITGVEHGSREQAEYACPKCRKTGPKSKTPSGKVKVGDGGVSRETVQGDAPPVKRAEPEEDIVDAEIEDIPVKREKA